jgi:hypothetical protein
MSGDAETPPTYYFSGITFNPTFYQSSSTDYLTLATAKSNFLTYPTAQGDETIAQIYSQNISTITPTDAFNFLSSQTSGQINIGSTATGTIKIGATTGTSIHAGSIDLQGTNINNAVASTTGTISLGPGQTTGTLNIGSHPTSGVRTTGAINIGSNSAGITPITIGTTGQSTIALNGTSVNVGTKITSSTYDSTSATTPMSVGGNLTSVGLSIGGSQTSGNIDIGNNAGRTNSGQVNICSNTNNAPTITIGSLSSNTALNGTSVAIGTKITSPVYDSSAAATNMSLGGNLTTGDLNIGALQTDGDINIGMNSQRTTLGAINIGAGSINGVGIVIGSGASNTTLYGTSVAIGTKLTSPVLDSSAAATNMSLGGNLVNGDLNICALQTAGDINIGQNASRGAGGAINISTLSTNIVPISIGSATSTVAIGNTLGVTGMLTANGGFTLPTTKTMTLTGNISGAGNITTTGTGTISSAGLITATSGITMGSNQTIFQTLGQQLRLGYANTQSSGGTSSSFGPFIKSFGPDTVTGTTYEILYDGTNGIVPTSTDGMGGLLTIVLKSGTSAKIMTVLYAMSKRVGITGFTSLGTAVSSNATGWTATPVFSQSGTANNILITFNAADWSGATVSWIFMGAV